MDANSMYKKSFAGEIIATDVKVEGYVPQKNVDQICDCDGGGECCGN